MPDFAVLIPSRFEFHVCESAVSEAECFGRSSDQFSGCASRCRVVERIEQLPLSGSHREICSAVRLLD